MSDLIEVTIGRVGRAHGIRGDVFDGDGLSSSRHRFSGPL